MKRIPKRLVAANKENTLGLTNACSIVTIIIIIFSIGLETSGSFFFPTGAKR